MQKTLLIAFIMAILTASSFACIVCTEDLPAATLNAIYAAPDAAACHAVYEDLTLSEDLEATLFDICEDQSY